MKATTVYPGKFVTDPAPGGFTETVGPCGDGTLIKTVPDPPVPPPPLQRQAPPPPPPELAVPADPAVPVPAPPGPPPPEPPEPGGGPSLLS